MLQIFRNYERVPLEPFVMLSVQFFGHLRSTTCPAKTSIADNYSVDTKNYWLLRRWRIERQRFKYLNFTDRYRNLHLNKNIFDLINMNEHVKVLLYDVIIIRLGLKCLIQDRIMYKLFDTKPY